MPDDERTLPNDSDSDSSLPGRFEESNPDFFTPSPPPPAPKSGSKTIMAAAIVFALVSAGFLSYYFANQNEIDAQILQNTYNLTHEEQLITRYGVGAYGSDHSHAAIAVFINGERLNFAHPQFQLASRYIHFESHNPYLIHRHATNAPLEMLFSSFGMGITSDCITLRDAVDTDEFCSDQDQALGFFVNGEKHSDISQYVIEHNDRILVSFGDERSVPKQLNYLESLKIFDVPKKTPKFSGNDILV